MLTFHIKNIKGKVWHELYSMMSSLLSLGQYQEDKAHAETG